MLQVGVRRDVPNFSGVRVHWKSTFVYKNLRVGFGVLLKAPACSESTTLRRKTDRLGPLRATVKQRALWRAKPPAHLEDRKRHVFKEEADNVAVASVHLSIQTCHVRSTRAWDYPQRNA
eukprot:6036481-Pleurochrysis_carterae.AAC.1